MFNSLANQILLFSIEISQKIALFLGQGSGGGKIAAVSDELGSGNAALVVATFFIFASFIIGMALGRSRLMISMVSLYIAYFLENIFPYQKEVASYFSNYDPYLIRVGLFFVFYILTFLVLGRSALRSRLTLAETPFFTIFFLSLIKAGFIISILLTYISIDVIKSYSPLIIDYFGTPQARFLWAVLPVISFIFVRKKRAEAVDKHE